MRYFNSLLELVGHTPLVRLNHVVPHRDSLFLVKFEAWNPGGSLKDRTALGMILDAESAGLLKPGMTIIEPTSGNTGVSLAWVAAVKGYKAIIVMPEAMSEERRNLLKAYGAEVVLTPSALGMRGAIDKAGEIARGRADYFIPQQFDNPSNAEIHRRTTAEEIWEDTGGEVDAFVVGVGTGGTVSGVGDALKKRNRAIRVFAVEPASSNVLGGGKPGPHLIQGIGAGFVPKVLDLAAFDEVIPVSNEAALETTRRLAREEGILAGMSTGANVWALNAIGSRPEFKGKTLVSVVCDSGERYLSTPLFREKG